MTPDYHPIEHQWKPTDDPDIFERDGEIYSRKGRGYPLTLYERLNFRKLEDKEYE